jgi:hypothetical protein
LWNQCKSLIKYKLMSACSLTTPLVLASWVPLIKTRKQRKSCSSGASNDPTLSDESALAQKEGAKLSLRRAGRGRIAGESLSFFRQSELICVSLICVSHFSLPRDRGGIRPDLGPRVRVP